MDFNKSIFENRQAKGSPLLTAHRGICGANVPCNSITAYKIALSQGADVVEIDVSKSKDGKFFVFHPGMEHVFLRSDKQIADMTAEEVEALYLVNQDGVKTSYKVPYLKDVLALLKDKVYINVDKFWTDVEGITREIFEAGVEKQVIVKTWVNERSIDDVAKYAQGLMFMPLVWNKDDISEKLLAKGVNLIGVEALFNTDDAPCASDEYIKAMHEKGLLVWGNSIVYNEADVISAYHTDDRALSGDPDGGWGFFLDKDFDFIQTDWLLMIKNYIAERGSK